MANLVFIAGVPHDPTLAIAARMAAVGKADPGAIPALKHFDALREKLEAARPDIVVMVGSDHLNQWFYDNLAPFMIGIAERMAGPFPSEIKSWGLDPCDLPVDQRLARHILKSGYENGVDFAFSNEFVADHSFTIPMQFLRPADDLPVVPVFINLLAPPVPPGRRYATVGSALRSGIESDGTHQRVALIVTGHMSNSVGGPNMLSIQKEPASAWDIETWALIEENRVDDILQRATWDQLYAQGNGTPGFLAYCVALGAARGAAPGFAEMVATGAQPPCAFLGWTESDLKGGAQ
ncbi:2,3-dihydroxybiphenyl 1,2-dioxygenase [Rhizobium sp. L1K21]|uniref:DODA-type extradiol aromatic ring-opening family dioxygenase n=1 Tax=Rhizobium sp. L1K21 TaxID=2954933 RepID=UPI002093C546|nr:2,3-dihydroxybiphenyl 1,2-dioxygenase [Rhizobium sp. L1K21]MCO6187598.1 2,3-dihydroxybiphenyl 1,2-dioxygenase [Rhizobium sp. L1K21]